MILERLTGDPNVRNRGCEIVLKAPQGSPVRIVSQLLRWHHGDAPAQKGLHTLLLSLAAQQPELPQAEIRALVIYSDLSEVKKHRAIQEFLEAGADVRWSPKTQTPFRMVNEGSKLMVAANPGDKKHWVTDAIYYEADGDDALIGMCRELFDTEFALAQRLRWDKRRERVRRTDFLKQFVVEFRKLFSPANLAVRLTLMLIASALAFLLGLFAD